MAFKPSRQMLAKEQFKNIIVESIKNAKDFYNNAEYVKFVNSVEIMDCMLESYKLDPHFITKAQKLLTTYKITEDQRKTMEVMDLGQQVSKGETKINLYREWFRILVDLANRTVFAGREMNVDINLEDVFAVWNEMRKIKISKDVVEEKITDITIPEKDEVDVDAE